MKRRWERHVQSALRLVAMILLCAFAGLALGILVAVKSTEGALDHFARALLAYTDRYNAEIDATLARVNASPYAFCSDEEIGMLRSLVFAGHLVKQIGRVRDNRLACTSLNGRLAQPLPIPRPDLVTPSGRSIWVRMPLATVPGLYGEVTQSGEANFVAAQGAFDHLGQAPMTYTTTLTNRLTHQAVRTAGVPLQLGDAQILGEQEVYAGDTLYLARCSASFAPCVVTGIGVRDAWRSNSAAIAGFVWLGTFTGLVLGIMLILEQREQSLAAQLQRALRTNQITLMYQPIVDVKTGRIVGAEALARWTNDAGEHIRPDVFVAAAEELGFVGKLTKVVLHLVVREMGPFLRGNANFHINVNIAAADLADPNFLPMLEKLLLKHSIAAGSINLELTERSTADHHLAISSIGKLRERGHQFYIDDFGTGYSSLSYLNELSVDAIKIDRAFTDAIGTGSLTAEIVPQILAMAETLKVKVVVEGVERGEQSAYFASLHQQVLAQGWHFGEAVPALELLELILNQDVETALS